MVHIWGLAFLAYMVLSLLWTPIPGEGALEARDFAALLTLCWIVGQFPREWIVRSMGLALVGLLVLHWTVVFGGQGNPNFEAELFALLIPWTFVGWWSVVGVVGAVIFLTLEPNLVWIAVMTVILGVACLLNLRVGLIGGGVLLAIGGIAAWLSKNVWSSVIARAEFWFNSGVMWLDKPVFGWGAGSFDWAYPLFQERHVAVWPSLDTKLHPITYYAGAAHNEVLQILAQYGLVGLLIAGAGLFCLFSRKADPRAIWTLFIGAALSMTGFPLHNPATGLVLAVSAGVLACGLPRWRWRDLFPSRVTLQLSRLSRSLSFGH